MQFEENKLNEFLQCENTKTKYVKLCDEDGNLVYNLTLPNKDTVQYVDPNLAMYVHSLERRLGVK